MRRFFLIVLGLALLLAGCSAPPDYDIRGIWTYTVTSEDGNTYDAGTITFNGGLGSGTYLRADFYATETIGEYNVSGSEVTLRDGSYTTLEGTLSSESRLSGSWTAPDGSGVWEAIRQP